MTDQLCVAVADYPQLRLLAWHLGDDSVLTELDALHLNERNWRFVGDLERREAEFVQYLADTYSSGRLLV